MSSASSTSARNFHTTLCTTSEEKSRCMAIRHQVFCIEQGYDPTIEVDEKDPLSDHFLLTESKPDGTIADVGTLRCYASPSESLLKLGRFAIHSSYRSTGAGRSLEQSFLLHLARRNSGFCQAVTKGKGEVDVVAYSQCIAVGFYTRLGWRTEGQEFLEEGQPHIKIVKTIKLDPEVKE